MKWTMIVIGLSVFAILGTACSVFSSGPDGPTPRPTLSLPPGTPNLKGEVPRPLPKGPCQGRLWGKVTNAVTGETPPNVTVEIAASGQSFKTITDANGLYGFAGLCGGAYTIALTPPSGKTQTSPNPVFIDPSKQVKADLTFE